MFPRDVVLQKLFINIYFSPESVYLQPRFPQVISLQDYFIPTFFPNSPEHRRNKIQSFTLH